jgi:hypothetical protein
LSPRCDRARGAPFPWLAHRDCISRGIGAKARCHRFLSTPPHADRVRRCRT